MYAAYFSKDDYSSLAGKPNAPLTIDAGNEDALSGPETYQQIPGTPAGSAATVPAEIYGPPRPESGADPAALPVPSSPSEPHSEKEAEPAGGNTLSKKDLECLAGGECASPPAYSKEKAHAGKSLQGSGQAVQKTKPAHPSGKKQPLPGKLPTHAQPGSGSDFVMPSVETPPLVPINDDQE